MTVQNKQIPKLSREERIDRNAILDHEKSIYDSPKIYPMKPIQKNEEMKARQEEIAKDPTKKNEILRGATGGVPPDLTEHESAKEHERLLVVAHKEFDEAQNAGNKWAERSATLIGTWDKIKELAYYKPKTWGNFLQEEFDFSPMQESRLRDVLKRFNLLSEPEQKQLSSGNNKNVISDGKPSASVVAALSDVPKALQTEILNELKDEGEKVTAKKVKEKIKEKQEPVAAEYETVVTDCDGNEIPKNIAAEFQRAEREGKEAITHVQAVKNYLENDDLTTVESRGLRETAKDLLAGLKTHQTKHVLCPKCAGKKCAVCSTRGFVSRHFATKGIGKPE